MSDNEGLLYADRVQETSTTTGTGTLTLLGAVTGYQSFASAFPSPIISQDVYYSSTDGTNFEVGKGTWTASGDTLTRSQVFASSNSGALVNWSGATVYVFVDLPAIAVVDKGLALAMVMSAIPQ